MTPTNSTPAELVQRLRHSIHEINNALTPILANAQLARVMVDPSGTDVREALDDVVSAATRANQLVSEMREISNALQETLEPEKAPGSESRRG